MEPGTILYQSPPIEDAVFLGKYRRIDFLPILPFAKRITLNQRSPMDPYKQFGTPIPHVTFWYQGKEFVLNNVVERWIENVDDLPVIRMRDEQGAYMAVNRWDAMIQGPGHSFF
jgi:hypothetical protein